MDLLDYINIFFDKLTETKIKFIFKQIVAAIEYCHYNNIMHRDLKPENILLNVCEDGYISELKVADFGMAREINQKVSRCDVFGSPGYKAPEGLKGKIKYDQKVDSWSLGIILYNLVCGGMPFKGDRWQMNNNAMFVNPKFNEKAWKQCSLNCKDLALQLLEKDHQWRLDVSEIQFHDWLTPNRGFKTNSQQYLTRVILD